MTPYTIDPLPEPVPPKFRVTEMRKEAKSLKKQIKAGLKALPDFDDLTSHELERVLTNLQFARLHVTDVLGS